MKRTNNELFTQLLIVADIRNKQLRITERVIKNLKISEVQKQLHTIDLNIFIQPMKKLLSLIFDLCHSRSKTSTITTTDKQYQ